jgi:2-desacetyl-2-hydroxyethyl bacteriochlorophyllide A dehydrogenase
MEGAHGIDVQRVVMVGPREVRIERDRLADDPLAPHDVVMRTCYSLISPGTELAHYTGTADLGHIPAHPYPWYPGYAAVGEVVAAGTEAGVRPGDLVLAHTPHQSGARFDCRRRVCVRIPDGVEPHVATVARLGQVSAVSLRTSTARAGDWAAVIGLGPVGNCAAQLLRIAGLRVLGVEMSPQRRALAERCGVSPVVDPQQPGALEAAVERSGGGCRLVLECSGRVKAVESALVLATTHGEVVLIGAAWWRDTEVLATDIVRPIFDRFLLLRSGWEWQLPLYGAEPPGSIGGCTEWVLDCIREGKLRAADLITDVIAPLDVAAAYRQLLEKPASHLAVVIDWTQSGG